MVEDITAVSAATIAVVLILRAIPPIIAAVQSRRNGNSESTPASSGPANGARTGRSTLSERYDAIAGARIEAIDRRTEQMAAALPALTAEIGKLSTSVDKLSERLASPR